MSLQTRLTDWVTAVGTDIKALRTTVSGEVTGSLTGLTTTAKTSLIAAINEVNAKPAAPAPSPASETVSGIAEVATQTETNTGTDDTRIVTPLKFQTRLAAYAQPLAANLTALAGQASTAYGRGLLNLADAAALNTAVGASSETASGTIELATQTEVNTGTDAVRAVTPVTFQTRLAAYAQPLAANLTSLAGQASTAYGRSLLNLADQAGLTGAIRAASETVTGVLRFATQAETNAGTLDSVGVTPLKFQTRLAAYAQPLAANLTTLAGITPGATGQSLLAATTAAGAKTTLGLAAVATSGSAADLTGTLPSSALPPLAISDTSVVATQAAMLALTAQRGDVAVRSDIGRTFILTTDDPTILANWVQLTAGGDVLSVAGKTGTVSLVKGDVGLGNVDNTSDANKPVSTAQQTALNLRLLASANLSDVASVATARTNLSVYSQAEIGNPETDLVAAYTTAKA